MKGMLGAVLAGLLLSACSAASTTMDAGIDAGTDAGIDAGSDDGSDGGVIHWGTCPFAYTPPGETILEDEMGMKRTVRDMHLRCEIDFESLQAEVFVKATAVRIENQSVVYEVSQVQVCRNGDVETLPNDQADFGNIGRHSWKTMDLAIDGRLYSFAMGEMCAGARPCSPWPDQFDVHNLPDMTLTAEALPALCSGVGEMGIPAPLVNQVRIPPEGSGVPFTQGSLDGDPDEQPLHTYTVYPNRLDVREASNDDFARFLSDHGNVCEGHICADTSGEGFRLTEEDGFWKVEEGAENLPVVQVSWYGAKEYCIWRHLILPYESTWEMAASAMGKRRFPWGDRDPSCDLALFDACGATGPDVVCLRDAGNSLEGVCNLAGNVSEWIGDYYEADQYAVCEQENSCQRGPSSSGTGERVIRGGSFALPTNNLRASDRNFASPDKTAADLGVRCMASNPSF